MGASHRGTSGVVLVYHTVICTKSLPVINNNFFFNTRQFTVVPLPKIRLKVQSVQQHWMTNPNMTARDLHRLLGMLVFMASLVQWGRLFVQSSGGPPEHGARGLGAGPTGSKFLSGCCQRWPGGHLQQSCKVFPSPPRRRK